MKARWLSLVLLALILILQFQLWVGDGSVGQQHQLKQQISEQSEHNSELEGRNQEIMLDIESLGDDAKSDAGVEERARSELGMIEENEVFYMVIDEDDDHVKAEADE
ncbi:UNVERIFIED_CONTAM: hypothetical protein GTU68_037031 [Idotea baltica]|nr:hypothetical protein [Idotea baltica]